MNILITGGAGYLGTTLVEELLMRRGKQFPEGPIKITVLDNLMYRQTPFLHLFSDERFEFVRGDVNNKDVLMPLVQEADVVIPLAAIVGFPACDLDPIRSWNTNTDHIYNILSWRKAGAKLVYPNTNSGYGVGDKDEACTEETPQNPISHYGKTKCESERIVLDVGGVALRLATVFGLSPRMRMDLLVNDFVYRAYKDRAIVLFEHTFRRNYIHVKDVAQAFIHAIINYDKMSGEAYNVGLSSANLTKMQLAQTIQKQTPFSIHTDDTHEDPDKRDYIVSNAKLEATGWEAKYDLDYGIKELLTGYQILDSHLHPYCNL
mgnify:CR=1 FL=1|tara:strand:+ start:9534 stop:10490 length:957 start_codon:yes stop_codon:yes gene_type:complete